jgi:tight adherence protein B
MSPRIVVLASLVVLLLMAAGSILLLHAQAKRDRQAARVRRITQPYQLRIATAASADGVALAEVSEGLARVAAQLFGFDPASPDHYVTRWWTVLLVTLLAALAAGWLAIGLLGPLMLLLVPPLWILLSRAFFNWCVSRRRGKLFVQFPDALAMIVRAVRVGIPVSDSIRAVGRELPAPTGPEFARLADELAIGVVLEEALQAMSTRNGLQEYYFFATALSLQNQTGGGLSETLENLADVIRKRVTVRERGRALSSEAQTSAIVLALLPPLAIGALLIMSPDYINLLFVEPAGKKILGLAMAMLVGGIMTMRFMIRKSLT